MSFGIAADALLLRSAMSSGEPAHLWVCRSVLNLIATLPCLGRERKGLKTSFFACYWSFFVVVDGLITANGSLQNDSVPSVS